MAHDLKHEHDDHGHTRVAVDPSIATSERGIWAVNEVLVEPRDEARLVRLETISLDESSAFGCAPEWVK